MGILSLNQHEKEILILKAAWESIDSFVNFDVLALCGTGMIRQIRFNKASDQKLFNILLLSFLHDPIYSIKEDCMTALKQVIANPVFNSEATSLTSEVNQFNEWLDELINPNDNGETRKFWFPSIGKDIILKISRKEFIEICGNIAKHNLLGLNRQAKVMQNIFMRSNAPLELTDALLIMPEFFEQFHDDLFVYHSTNIAEHLNNIRWAIYEYLLPLFNSSIEDYWNDSLNIRAYRYRYPDDIVDSYAKALFWDLMNDIRSKPYMPKFQTGWYLKQRY